MLSFHQFQQRIFSRWGFALFLILIVLSFVFIDKPLAIKIHDLNFDNRWPLLNVFTQLGKASFLFIVFPLVALFFRYVRINKYIEIRAWFLWLCLILSQLVCLVMKVFFGRARPQLLFDEQLFGFYWFKFKADFWSFPSGHTMAIMAVMWGFCALYPRQWFSFVLFGFMVACTRILLVHHYLSDVIAAFFLSGFVVFWITARLNFTNKLWQYTGS